MSNKKKTSLRIFPDNWINSCRFKNFFNNINFPLEVDIGSGKGRFLLNRALNNKNINFLGIERQLNRINRSGKKLESNNIQNVRLLRIESLYAVKYLIPENYISNYYIMFPDPWPKDRHSHNRLLNVDFINGIHKSLLKGGSFHIATDHKPYFDLIYPILKNDKRFLETNTFIPNDDEKTDFELIYIDKVINRCSFQKI